MTKDIKKINRMSRCFWFNLIKIGQTGLRNSYNIKPVVVSKLQMKQFLVSTTGIPEDVFHFADKKYALTSWDKWQEIFEHDLTNLIPYMSDFFDCDNFADYFAATMAAIFKLNSVGRYSVALYNTTLTKLLGFHRANIIVASNQGVLKAYLYDAMEGMDDGWTEITKENQEIIKNWVYNPHYIEFN